MPNYIAVVHKEPAIDEAKYLAYEALLLHVEGQREEG